MEGITTHSFNAKCNETRRVVMSVISVKSVCFYVCLCVYLCCCCVVFSTEEEAGGGGGGSRGNSSRLRRFRYSVELAGTVD